MGKPIFRALNASFPALKLPFSFEIAANAKCAVYGPKKRDLLNIIAGKVSDPTKRISFPAIGQNVWPSEAIQFVSFGQSTSASAQAPFVGARYESFRDEFDESLATVLNSRAPEGTTLAEIKKISDELDLTPYWSNWYVGLSNGQSRRAQLAQALLRKPQLLVMDEPFLGLDPVNRQKFSTILSALPIPVVIGLKGGDSAPFWINQTIFASETVGIKEGEAAIDLVNTQFRDIQALRRKNQSRPSQRSYRRFGAPVIEMSDVTIKFKHASAPIFDKLSFVIRDGERVHIRGPNGSGKSTLLALITADHPQSWSNDVKLFGEKLEVGKHSYFSINQQIGCTSPELHAIFPRFLNAKRAISTGFSGSMIPSTELSSEQQAMLEKTANKLNIDLNSGRTFGEMSLGEQKLVLLARALVKSPRILIMDEALSALPGAQIERALAVIDEFEGTVLVVGHVDEETPMCDKVISLGQQ